MRFGILALMLVSCVPFQGSRTATTVITSTPEGADAYIVHEGGVYDALYTDKPQGKNADGKTMVFMGRTPLQIDVPKDMYTKVMVVKNGYDDTTFTVKAKKEASYFDGRNRDCMADKYYVYATPFSVWDEVISGSVLKGIKNDYCKEVRHSYHINLQAKKEPSQPINICGAIQICDKH